VLFIRGFAFNDFDDKRRNLRRIPGSMIKAPDITFVYVVVAFIASLAILKRFLFVPLTAILEEREREAATAEKVHADSLAEVEKSIARAEAELAKARGEALAIREKLRGEGHAQWERRLAEAQAASGASLDRATDEIGAAAQKASEELPRSARALARALAEKILGRKIAA
jgi:F-type H+-transporting ATPase subunit b